MDILKRDGNEVEFCKKNTKLRRFEFRHPYNFYGAVDDNGIVTTLSRWRVFTLVGSTPIGTTIRRVDRVDR